MAEANRLLVQTFSDYSLEATKMALAQSTLDASQINLILSSKGLQGEILETTTAELANATATNAMTASETTATGATVGLKNAFKGLSTSIKGFISTHSGLVAISIAIAAIAATVKIIDLCTTSFSELKEKISDLKQEISDSDSNMESYKNQLDDINKKISEINQQGTLSITDENELKNLQTQRTELENLYNIEKARHDLAQQDLENTVNDYLNKTSKSSYKKENYTQKQMKKGQFVDVNVSQAANTTKLEEMEAASQEMLKQQHIIEQINEEYNKLNNPTKDQTEEYNSKLLDAQNARDKAKQIALDIQKEATEQVNGLDSTSESYKKVMSASQDLSDALAILNNDFNALSENGKRNYIINRFKNNATKDQLQQLEDAKQYLEDEYQKISNWGLDDYADQIKNGTLSSQFGNVDMDNRQIIDWNIENIEKWKDALSDIKYYDDNGNFIESYYDQLKESAEEGKSCIDTVFGALIDQIEGYGDITAISFSHIVNNDDGSFEFLGQKTAEEYLYGILDIAKQDGDMSIDHILELDKKGLENAEVYDAQGKEIGKTYIHGIISGFNDNAEDISELTHFAGKFGAIKIAKDEIAKLEKQYGKDGSQAIKDFFDTEGIDTKSPLINEFNEVTEGITNADEAIKKWIEHKKEANQTSSFTKDPTDLLRDSDDKDRKDTSINLADLKNRADVMKTIQKEIEETGDIGVDTLQTLNKQFPEASEALYDYISGVKNGAEFFSELEDKYDEDKNKYVENMVEKNQANEDFFNSLKANYPEVFAQIQNFMNQGNELLEQTKNNYINSIIAEEESCDSFLSFIEQTYPEIYRQLAEVYDNDKENFIRHLFSENESNQEFIQAISTMYPELANALSTVYQNDVSNWTSMEQAKVNISAQAIQKIAQLYKNFYEAMGVSNGLGFIENVNKKVSSDATAHFSTNPFNSTFAKENKFNEVAKVNIPEYSELINNVDQVIADMQNAQNSLSKSAADSISSSIDLSYDSLGKDTDSSSKDKDDSDSDSDKQTEEDFDWIERVVKKIERTISNLGSIVDDTYSDWSKRNNALLDELNAVSEEIGVQEQAAQRYFELADSVGLDDNYKNLVQNGAFDVETITDDTLKEQIKNYQDYYDKATDAQDKVLELKKNYNDLNNQRLDHLTSEFEQLNNSTDRAIQNSQDILDDDYVNSSVKDGEFANQRNNYLNSISLKEQERQRLIDEFNATGIDINSKAGYQWLTSLQGIDDEIKEIYKNLNSLNGTRLDYITSEFDKLNNATDRAIQNSQNILDDSHVSYYAKDTEIGNQRNNYLNSLALKEQEYQRLTEEFAASGIDANSEAGYDWLTKLQEVQDEIDNINDSLKDLNDTTFDNLSNEFKNIYQWTEEQNNIWKYNVDNSFSSWTDRDNSISILKDTIQQQTEQYNEYRNKVIELFQQAQEDGNSEAAQKYYSEIFSIDSTLRSLNQDYNSTLTSVLDHSVAEFEQKYNYIETVMKNTESIMNDDTKSYSVRNKALIDQISNVTTAIAQQQEQREKLVREFNESGIQPDTEEWYKWLQQVQACDDTILDLQEQSRSLNKQKFDDIKTQFENINNILSSSVDILDKYISIVETKGLFADESLYTKSIKIYQGQLQNQINEKDRLTEEMNKAIKNGVDESSEQFISMESDIRDVNSSILETINTIEGLKKSIRELDFSKFEYLQDNISNVTSEANYYIDLIDKMGSNLYNDQGNITKEGITTAALHLQNKDTYLKQAQGYANKIKEIEEQIANDPTNKDLLDKKQEYVEAQREAYLSVIDEKKAVEDLVKDGYQKQLDYIQKIIDKKKEQMDEESDAYEYQKSIAEKTANLSKLYKQEKALTQMNDDSEENLKKIQELKVSIEEAEKDLQETEYEKMKSDRQKQLDNLQDEFSDMIDNMTQNIDQNLIDILNEVNSSSVAIINTLKELSGNSGLDLSDTISSIYNNGSSYSNLNTSTSAIGQNYSKTNEAINSLTANIKNLISNMEKESTQKQYNIDVDTTVLNNKVDEVNNTIKNTIGVVADLNDTIKNTTNGELSNINDSIKDLTNSINGNTTNDKNDNSNNELGIGSPIQKEPKDELGSPIQKDITESRVDIPRLESTNTDTNNSPVACSYTHEDMSEPIELSDGTILLPVDNNELSFDNGMYEQLYNLSKDNFINNNINSIPTPVTANSNISAPTTVTYAIDMGGVTVNDVNDPKEFAQQLRYTIANDAKTKKILKASTTDQLRGRSEKEVYKYV